MKNSALFSMFASIMMLQGCAVHPLQDDVTKVETLTIVNHIRCETRQAIIAEVTSLLDKEQINASASEAERIANIYAKFIANPGAFTKVIAKHYLNKDEYLFYSKYIDTGIAFEFSLDVQETNNISAGMDPLGVFSYGLVKVGLTASDNRTRDATRSFIVSDTFEELLKFNGPCKPESLLPNLNYPISGSIGMGELIRTFIALNQGAPVADSVKPAVDLKSNSPVFADTLKFTTAISGTVNPVVTLGPATPATKGLRLLDANLSATATRQDIHQVIIALSLTPAAPASKTKSSGADSPLGALSAKSIFSKRSVAPDSAEERAIEAITQQRLNNFYDRYLPPL